MAGKFVKMAKDGQAPIDVHPSVVENHKQLGWTVVEEREPEPEKKPAKPADKKADK